MPYEFALEAVSTLVMGGYDTNDFTGNMTWYDTSNCTGGWNLTATSVDVGDQNLNMNATVGPTVEFQTGYPYIGVPAVTF